LYYPLCRYICHEPAIVKNDVIKKEKVKVITYEGISKKACKRLSIIKFEKQGRSIKVKKQIIGGTSQEGSKFQSREKNTCRIGGGEKIIEKHSDPRVTS